LLNAFMASPRRNVSPRTQADNEHEKLALVRSLGHCTLESVKPTTIAQYLEKRGAPVRANREISLLSRAFSWAVAQGLADRNPCLGVERNKEQSRKRSPSVAEIETVAAKGGAIVAAGARLAYLTGQRQAQIIGLRIDQLQEDGIHFPPAKKGDAVIVEWTAALRDAIEAAKKMRPKIASATHLFSGRKGQPFTQEGFQAAWQRAMAAWLSEMPEERTRCRAVYVSRYTGAEPRRRTSRWSRSASARWTSESQYDASVLARPPGQESAGRGLVMATPKEPYDG
jgi:integrase